MKKTVSKKKALPTWVPIVVIAVFIVIIALVIMKLTSSAGKVNLTSQDIANIQKRIDAGWIHPMATAEQLEAKGIKLPANYPRQSDKGGGRSIGQ